MKTIFGLVDCNNFYVSCERVFDHSLNKKAVAVLSQNDGCIVARSNEVKALGVPMGAPLFKYEPLLRRHDVQIFSSNYQLYGDMSARVMSTLRRHAPAVEQYSIDEAFLELTKTSWAHNPQERLAHAQKIRQTVLQWTGIPTCIGLGPTKTLAKVANKIAKKMSRSSPLDRPPSNELSRNSFNFVSPAKSGKAFGEEWIRTKQSLTNEDKGVFDITDHPKLPELLEQLDVADIWGVGRQYSKMLYQYGIRNAKKLCEADDDWIKKKMTIVGLKTVWELRGISCFDIEEQPPPKQAIAHCRSFGTPITSLQALKESVAEYTAEAAAKARAQHSMPRALHLFVTTSRFAQSRYSNSMTIPFTTYSSYSPILIDAALQAVEHLYRGGFTYKKAGVILLDLIPDTQGQEGVFERSETTSKMKSSVRALDAINKKWGRKTVFYASQGVSQKWRVRPKRRSQGFTTHWDQLPTVKSG